MAPAKEKWIRRFIIPETTRHKKGFTIYKVTSMVFLKTSYEEISKVSVWKRYNDFKKLYTDLSILYNHADIKEPFPPFPKSRFFGRFEAEVIIERKEHALKFLEFIGRHLFLYSSDTFVQFFETSHTSSNTSDCSLSMSSDTSEDDRQAYLNNFKGSTVSHNMCTENDLMDSDKVYKKNYIHNHKVDELQTEGVHTIQPFISHKIFGQQERNILKTCKSSLSVHNSANMLEAKDDSAEYILIAAVHMSAALKHESLSQYEEAFTQYKMGISHLLTGIETDADLTRTTLIKEKISKYTDRAESLYNTHLNCNLSISGKPVSELQNYKICKIMKSVMLVMDLQLNCLRIIKAVEKSHDQKDNINNYILQGRVACMVNLYAYIETETTVFLVLEYAKHGRLWDFIESHCKLQNKTGSTKQSQQHSSILSNQVISNSVHFNDNAELGKTENPMNVEYAELLTVNLKSEDNENDSMETESCKQELNVKMGSYSSQMPTRELLENSQKLIQSVTATLKISNSVVKSLHERQHLVSQPDNVPFNKIHIINQQASIVKISADISQMSNENRRVNTFNECYWKQNVPQKEQDVAKTDSLFIYTEKTSSQNSSCTICNKYTGLNIYDPNIFSKATDNVHIQDKPLMNKTNECLILDNLAIDQILWKKTETLNTDDSEQQALMISEARICHWAAEIILGLEEIHRRNIFILDFNLDNILLGESGNILLTYIIPYHNTVFYKIKQPYSSPELCTFSPVLSVTAAADIWSFGVILYELLTGTVFKSRHTRLFNSHSTVSIPNKISNNAQSLLLSILKYSPSERLTISEIKQHAFFANIDWASLLNS